MTTKRTSPHPSAKAVSNEPMRLVGLNTAPTGRAKKKAKAVESTNVAIIGGGRGGKALMEIFANDPLVKIVGLAEIRLKATGYKLAGQLGIPVTNNYRDFLTMKHVDLVIDVTGNPEVGQALQRVRRSNLAIIGGASAKFMWQLIDARIRATTEIEKTLMRYQSLFQRYVKDEAERAVNEERTRIACEIHDGLIQTLAGVNFKMERCAELVQKDPGKCQTMLKETKAHLKHGIQATRQVVLNLQPGQYEKLELGAALRNFLKSFQAQNRVHVEFLQTGDEHRLAPKTKVFVFRIVQEALNNAHTHARATHVSVQLTIDSGMLTGFITDNGIGFNVKAVAKDPEKWDHFGLRGMKERARLLGGEAHWDSKKGQGTKISIQIPLTKQEHVRS